MTEPRGKAPPGEMALSGGEAARWLQRREAAIGLRSSGLDGCEVSRP
jgi:hypothetical protein